MFFQRALGAADPSGILLLSHDNRGNFWLFWEPFFKSGHQNSSLPLPARPPKLAPKKSTLLTDRKLTKKGCEIRIAVFSEVAHLCFYKYGLYDLWRISPLHTPTPPTQYVYITTSHQLPPPPPLALFKPSPPFHIPHFLCAAFFSAPNSPIHTITIKVPSSRLPSKKHLNLQTRTTFKSLPNSAPQPCSTTTAGRFIWPPSLPPAGGR